VFQKDLDAYYVTLSRIDFSCFFATFPTQVLAAAVTEEHSAPHPQYEQMADQDIRHTSGAFSGSSCSAHPGPEAAIVGKLCSTHTR